jgi:hypothetical protein
MLREFAQQALLISLIVTTVYRRSAKRQAT